MAVEEILVHISAPSTGKDDARYRRLAEAYDSFQTVPRIPLAAGQDVAQQNDNVATQSHPSALDLPAASVRQPLRDITASKDQTLQVPRTADKPSVLLENAAHNPTSMPGDPIGFIEDTALAAAALESQLLTSSLVAYETPSPSPVRNVDAASGIDVPKSFSATGKSKPQGNHVSLDLVPSSIDTGPHGAIMHIPPPTAAQPNPAAALAAFLLSKPHTHPAPQPTHTLPPPPAASLSSRPQTHLTLLLSDNLAMLPQAEYFDPYATFTRPLRMHERGHWRIDTSLWPPDATAEFWTLLGEYIGQGRAGWGVSCAIGEDAGFVEVFCWGETVPAVFLLMYVASANRVRRCEAVWIDGRGLEVVRMRKK